MTHKYFKSLQDSIESYFGKVGLFWIFSLSHFVVAAILISYLIVPDIKRNDFSIEDLVFLIIFVIIVKTFYRFIDQNGNRIESSDFNIFNMKILKSLIFFIAIHLVAFVPFIFADGLMLVALVILFALIVLFILSGSGFVTPKMFENSGMEIIKSLFKIKSIKKDFISKIPILMAWLSMDILILIVTALIFGIDIQ